MGPLRVWPQTLGIAVPLAEGMVQSRFGESIPRSWRLRYRAIEMPSSPWPSRRMERSLGAARWKGSYSCGIPPTGPSGLPFKVSDQMQCARLRSLQMAQSFLEQAMTASCLFGRFKLDSYSLES